MRCICWRTNVFVCWRVAPMTSCVAWRPAGNFACLVTFIKKLSELSRSRLAVENLQTCLAVNLLESPPTDNVPITKLPHDTLTRGQCFRDLNNCTILSFVSCHLLSLGVHVHVGCRILIDQRLKEFESFILNTKQVVMFVNTTSLLELFKLFV